MSGVRSTLKTQDDLPLRAARLERYLHDAIPLVRSMHAQVQTFDANGLTLCAPLAPNINHEMTAFGGSLASLATLACWGLLWLELEDRPDVSIVVNESHLHYLQRVNGELRAHCTMPAADVLETFLKTLARRGKARIELEADILHDGRSAARYHGMFVATRHRG